MRPTSAAVLCALPLLLGCAAKRTLRVTSTPNGATVRLDGETVGTTPVTVPFTYYGVRRLTVTHEGYLSRSEPIELRAPWYGRFPWDIFSEVLLPIGWRDRRKVHFDLVQGDELTGIPSLGSVIERAAVLRLAGPEGPRDLPSPEPLEAEAVGGEDAEP